VVIYADSMFHVLNAEDKITALSNEVSGLQQTSRSPTY